MESLSSLSNPERLLAAYDSILTLLINAAISGSIDYSQKVMLDSALCFLLGERDLKFLKSTFGNAKKAPNLLKLERPSKFALVLDKVATKCLEHLRRSDPELSSFTVPGLLSFITKGKSLLPLRFMLSKLCSFIFQLIGMIFISKRLLI